MNRLIPEIVKAMIESRDDWSLQAVNLVQGLIGCAYGFVGVETIAATAQRLRAPEPPYEDVFIRGVVFGCVTRKIRTLSTAERALLTELMEEIGHVPKADVRKLVADLRSLLGIRGPGMAEKIRDIIDRRYASKLTARVLSSEMNVSVSEAKVEFERRFGVTIAGYMTQRRVEEGMRMIRAGTKVEPASLQVGYKSKRHFYAAVWKLTGTTPKRVGGL